jgi:hypothetical protein
MGEWALFVKYTKQFIKELGLDKKAYSGHSYRIGGATSGAAAGFTSHELKILGRWNSEAYLGYIRTPEHALFNFAKRMANKK